MIDEPVKSDVSTTDPPETTGDERAADALTREDEHVDASAAQGSTNTEVSADITTDDSTDNTSMNDSDEMQDAPAPSVEEEQGEQSVHPSVESAPTDDSAQVESALAGEADDDDGDDGDDVGDIPPVELIADEPDEEGELKRDWYILKVQVNREQSICEALQRRIKIEGLERFFGDILVPTEDVREFNKSGKQRVVKRKLYPGYIVVHMSINDDTWFLVRETPGIGDFTGSAGKPTPMAAHEIDRILKTTKPDEDGEKEIKTTIKFKTGDRVRVKEGYFQNFEGEIHSVDETHGRVIVLIQIFGRPTEVELEHWQVEDV